MTTSNSFDSRRTLQIGDKSYTYYSLSAAEEAGVSGVSRLPVSMKVLLENLLRNEGPTVEADDIRAVADFATHKGKIEHEIAFRPARVLMQDFTGVPAVVDLAAMRDAMHALGADPSKINPLNPVDLVIDHSVMVDNFGTGASLEQNEVKEYERNGERYRFLRWGSSAFDDFRVVPPGTGICHQVNLEYLAQTVWTGKEGEEDVAYPDTVVGTDSHTTMVNGLSVLGWGVGGIEAEAAMLGQPIPMLIPEVIGFRLTGAMSEGTTATDLVLTVTQMLRKKGVVGKFVEFYGDALASMTIEDQATIANMAPEYGATCGFFPVSPATLKYLADTGRTPERVALVEAYAKAQGMWSEPGAPEPVFTDTLELDISTVQTSLAGPRRPQDRVLLTDAAAAFAEHLHTDFGKAGHEDARVPVKVEEGQEPFSIGHGDVVIAAITSCTNTSNPSVLIAAGLVARKAREKGLKVAPWVKTSLAPGSQVVTDYLIKAGLQDDLDAMGFNLVGYGCTTCIGNSGPLPQNVSDAINADDLVACSVLSGNRNFEGRVNPDVRANYLASPPLVVAYALAGTMLKDLSKEPIGIGADGTPVYLGAIWPTNEEIATIQRKVVTNDLFARRYADVFKGDARWQGIAIEGGRTYAWEGDSTYVQNPPYFEGMTMEPKPVTDIQGAAVLAIFGDSHHHRPHQPGRQHQEDLARRPVPDRPRRGCSGLQQLRRAARQPPGDDARHLRQHPHQERHGARHRRRDHQALSLGADHGDLRRRHAVRGRRAPAGDLRRQGIRHRQLRATGRPRARSSWACGPCSPRPTSASTAPTSWAWACLPLQYQIEGWQKLGLTGEELITIRGLTSLSPRKTLIVELYRPSDGKVARFPVTCRIDTETELDYFKAGGVMPYVLRNLARQTPEAVAAE